MRAVLDTNTVVSGIFFGGVPRALLESWAERRFELVLTPEIFDEYLRVCERLATTRPQLEFRPILTMFIGHGTLMPDAAVERSISVDPDDDKFMRCAHSASAVVLSGERHLLEAAGWRGVQVVTPRAFLESLTVEGS